MSHKKRSKGNTGKGDYDVGYRKPPKHTRFKLGQSGNPRGRPKGTRNFRTDVKATLLAPVRVTREGKARKISTQEAMLFRLREMALRGDARAIDRLVELAGRYNNEEPSTNTGMSVDDAELIDIFRARMLSGAVAKYTTPQDDQSSHPDDGTSTETRKIPRRKIKRYGR